MEYKMKRKTKQNDEELIHKLYSPTTIGSGAIFFVFDKSGDVQLQARTSESEEAQEFIARVMFLINAWMSNSEGKND